MAEASATFAFETLGHPAVVASEPEPDAQDVPLDASIVLRFSTLMDTASVEDALQVSPAVLLTATWSGERLTLTPEEPLAEGTQYTLRISTDARDSAGVSLEPAYRLTFRAARSGLGAETLFPADATEGIALTTPIAIVFDREVDPDTLDAADFRVEPEVAGSLEAVALPGAAGLEQPGIRAVRFAPSGSLDANTTYTITLDAGLAGADGSLLPGAVSWRFTTGSPLSTLSNQVVFLSDRAGIANLWTMNPDGSGQRQVSAELSPITAYAVAPDGRSLVLGDGAVLVELRADGSERQLLTEPGILEFDPAYAPNGSAIAFGRADAATGSGLGLFTRQPGGGDATALELPDELRRTPTPAPSPSGSPEDIPAPILRAPRFSPDGAALAFVDTSGRVGVLELPAERLSTAPFRAVSPPAWLPDASGVLLGGLRSGTADDPEPGAPLPPLDPALLGLSTVELGTLELVQLDRGAIRVEVLDRPGGAARPAASTGDDAGYLYIVTRPGQPGAGGELWVAVRAGGVPRHLLDDGGPAVSSASFGLEPGSVVAARVAGDDARPDPDAGIWLLNATTGRAEQLSADGWLPRWLP
jgi:hypothetical protein